MILYEKWLELPGYRHKDTLVIASQYSRFARLYKTDNKAKELRLYRMNNRGFHKFRATIRDRKALLETGLLDPESLNPKAWISAMRVVNYLFGSNMPEIPKEIHLPSNEVILYNKLPVDFISLIPDRRHYNLILDS